MNGVLVVNKEAGMTSRDVVNELCHILNTKHIGHTGTLDPIASGVLVCTIGKYTKLCDDLVSTYKEYIAEMKLGIKTDTYDITGKVLDTKDVVVSNKEIYDTILSFKKEYMQEVPIYSSVKINGKKLYEYARENKSVELPKRLVNIKEIEVLSINDDIVKFKCLVSKGTYIRSLINDIGNKLGCYAIMVSLVRTRQGKFSIVQSYKLSDIKSGNYKLLDLKDVLNVKVANCRDNLYKLINNGAPVSFKSEYKYILFRHDDEDISLYKFSDGKFRMYIKLK